MEPSEKRLSISDDSNRVLAAMKRHIEDLVPVDVPELSPDGKTFTIHMRRLGLWEARRIRRDHGEDAATFTMFVVIRCACDETGKRLFDERARLVLQDAPADIMMRLATAAQTGSALLMPIAEDAEKN